MRNKQFEFSPTIKNTVFIILILMNFVLKLYCTCSHTVSGFFVVLLLELIIYYMLDITYTTQRQCIYVYVVYKRYVNDKPRSTVLDFSFLYQIMNDISW